MDSLYFLGSQVCELVAVITFPTEFHSCDSFNFVGLLEDDHQFTYDIVDTWGHFSEADHISPDLWWLEILSGSWPCFHKLLLILNTLTSPEDTILNNKLSRFDQALNRQKRLSFLILRLVSYKRTRNCLNLMKLQIDDKVIDLLEGTSNPSHNLYLLQQAIFSNDFV